VSRSRYDPAELERLDREETLFCFFCGHAVSHADALELEIWDRDMVDPDRELWGLLHAHLACLKAAGEPGQVKEIDWTWPP
jgi:hypothetical protein